MLFLVLLLLLLLLSQLPVSMEDRCHSPVILVHQPVRHLNSLNHAHPAIKCKEGSPLKTLESVPKKMFLHI
jgi:hypothetical protein